MAEDENILEECRSIVEEVCEKYHYDREDKEGNDSLRTVLLKEVPAMLKNSSKEDRNLFYQMLSHTPIAVTENLTLEKYEELEKQYIGEINSHIVSEAVTVGEYGKTLGKAAYVSVPILDEDMELKGKKSFIYVQKVAGKAKEFLGTDIHVSHLIHELGHAFASEQGEYSMENGVLTRRAGTLEMKSSFSRREDGKVVRKWGKVEGVFIEEAMNSIEEEEAMANYMGISREEMQKNYGEILTPTVYQQSICEPMRDLQEKTYKQDFKNWRLHGDKKSKQKIENLIGQTKTWGLRKEAMAYSYGQKRALIEKNNDSETREFFHEQEELFFPNIDEMSPLQKIDNTLAQIYNLYSISLQIPETCVDFMNHVGLEIYPFINQAEGIKVKEEVRQSVEKLTASSLRNITTETKKAVQQFQLQNEGKGEEIRSEK